MTVPYLANPNPDAGSKYIIAIGHWEVVLSQAYQAWCLLVTGAQEPTALSVVVRPKCDQFRPAP
jgi:hypothetical protein